jgi:hypothetical protein
MTHDDAQNRIVLMRARLLARFAKHLRANGHRCTYDDLRGSDLATAITRILLDGLEDMLEPAAERATPTVSPIVPLAPLLEPDVVDDRPTAPAVAPQVAAELHRAVSADDPWRDEPTVRARFPSSIRPKA